MNEGGVGYKIFRMNEIFGGRMVDGGKMKYANILAEEFADYRLNPGDVLFNRTNPRRARSAKSASPFPDSDDELH